MKSLELVKELLDKYQKENDDKYLNLALAHFYRWYEVDYPKKSKLPIISNNLKIICDLLVLCKNQGLHILDEVFIQVLCAYCLILHEEKGDVSDWLNLIYGSIIYNTIYINHAFDGYIETASNSLLNTNHIITTSLKKTYNLYQQFKSFNTFIAKYPNYPRLKAFIRSKLGEIKEYLYAFYYPDNLLSLGKESIKLSSNNDFYTLKPDKTLFIYPHVISLHQKDYRFTYQHYYNENNKFYDNISLTLYFQKMFLLLPNEEKCLVTINGYNYLHDESQINKAEIVSVKEEVGGFLITSINELYPETTILSHIMCLDKHLFLFFDIDSINKQTYGINLYLNPKLTLRTSDTSVTLYYLQEKQLSLNLIYSSIPMFFKEYDNNQVTFEGQGKKENIIFHISVGDVNDDIKILPAENEYRIMINKEKFYIISKRRYT